MTTNRSSGLLRFGLLKRDGGLWMERFRNRWSAAVGNSGWEGKMADANKRGIPRYIIVAGVILVACVVASGVTLFLRDRSEKEILNQLERSQADLRMLGGADSEHQRREPHFGERLHKRIRAD